MRGAMESPGGDRGAAATVRWLLEEAAWLLLAAVPWILAAAYGWVRTGLFGLHGTVLVYTALRERSRLAGWLGLRFRDVLVGVAGGGTILFLGAGYGWGLARIGVELPDMASQLRALVPSLPALLAWGALLVPVTEELLFRGRMLRALDHAAGPTVSVLVTSLAFMLVHGIPEAFPAYFAFGLIFVFLRRKTGGLVAPVVAHAVNNFFGIALGGS
jgi:membrane protease YdiL (CAAX protease family)